jgi:hypothetical protein
MLVPVLFADTTAGPTVATPADPFADQYRPPRVTEVGTTAGQLRFLASAGGMIDSGPSLAGQGTFELMTIPWIGVRASTLVTVPLRNDPQLVSFRLGPSFHVFPYKRFDLSLFFDAGPALVDIATSQRTVMPVLGAGATFEIALSSYFVLHFEGLLHGGIADRGGVAHEYIGPVALAGLGLTL